MVEGWLPPSDDESPDPSAQDVGESPPARGNEDDEDESEEEIAPLVRRTRGQHQRDIEASRSLERHDDDDELPEHTSRHEATPSKKKKKEVKAPPKKKAKPAKQPSPPHSPSSSDATSLARGEAPQTMTAPDIATVLNEVPLASMPPPFAPVSGSGAAPVAVASPPKDAPAENVSEAPAATSTTKKPSVSWARDVLEMGFSRRLGPELEKPAGIRTGLCFIPVAK